jgi:dTDP-4-dehydrorhamnose reductase
MKILITGANGALGREMTGLLHTNGIEYLATDKENLDITDFKKTYASLMDYRPDIVFHFAAISNVDRCEKIPETALRVNALASLGLAVIASKIGARLVYMSTNFVFDGKNANGPYGEYDEPNPINTYGKTKLLGENYVKSTCSSCYIVRTSWLFGRYSRNFISRFLNNREKPAQLDVVCDRFASFTYTPDLAQALLFLVKSDKFGVYHIVNRGVGSFLDFLCRAQTLMKFRTEIRPINAENLDLLAARPKYSPLASKNYEILTNRQMRTWQDALADFVNTLYSQS